MILCVCKAVRPQAVLDAVGRGAHTVEAVGACTGAGTGCGVCRDDLRRLVERARAGAVRPLPVEEPALAAK